MGSRRIDGRSVMAAAEAFRQTPANTIYGGTAEILRSLVAERELGLVKS
jgi:alkylation response protein AidB-like acyl-CoA dehydrogenase